jgi:hypothetical protein
LYSLIGLVRLELANHVQPDSGIRSAQFGPFRGGFLNPVFAEVPLTCSNQRQDGLSALRLGYGDEGDIIGIAPRFFRRAGDMRTDIGKTRGSAIIVRAGWIGHVGGL